MNFKEKFDANYKVASQAAPVEMQTVWVWWPGDGWFSLKNVPIQPSTENLIANIGRRLQKQIELKEDLVISVPANERVIEVVGPRPDRESGLLVFGKETEEEAKRLATAVGYDAVFFRFGETLKPFIDALSSLDAPSEAAPPTASMKKASYYHGTPTKQKADKVWKDGIKPDLSKAPESQISKPIAGRVYCTMNIKEALPYALGANCAGHDPWPDYMKKYGQYGYLFVIKGKQFSDIQPDEDQVGQAVYEKKLPWLLELAETYLWDMPSVTSTDSEEGNLLEDVHAGEYDAWIKAGKILLNKISDKQKLEIIKKYGNVAHEGTLHPTEMWQIDRSKTAELKEDGSNFFKVAKLVKKRN